MELLVDTGADRTILAPLDALRFSRRLGVDLTTLPRGQASTGMGGHMETRVIDAVLTLESFSTPLAFTVLEAPPERLPIPSLLGRDILSRFALYVEQAENLVLLLEPEEAATVRPHLP
ncbi:MAG: retroviral-like aspartic protease family protein [Chloroflexi bacterium]|nr:retroviral-like aspartic protease family protein [Chloroflexota bacterium]